MEKTNMSVFDRTLLLAAFKLKGIDVMPSDFTHAISADRVKVSIPNKAKFSVSRKSIEKFMRMVFWVVPVTTAAGNLVYHIYGTEDAANRGVQFLQAKLNTPSNDGDPKVIKPVQKVAGESLIEATADGEQYWHYSWPPSSIVAKM